MGVQSVDCFNLQESVLYGSEHARPRSKTVRRHPHTGAGATTRDPERTSGSRHPPAHFFMAFMAFAGAAFIAFARVKVSLAGTLTFFMAFMAFAAFIAFARVKVSLATAFTVFMAFMAFAGAAPM